MKWKQLQIAISLGLLAALALPIHGHDAYAQPIAAFDLEATRQKLNSLESQLQQIDHYFKTDYLEATQSTPVIRSVAERLSNANELRHRWESFYPALEKNLNGIQNQLKKARSQSLTPPENQSLQDDLTRFDSQIAAAHILLREFKKEAQKGGERLESCIVTADAVLAASYVSLFAGVATAIHAGAYLSLKDSQTPASAEHTAPPSATPSATPSTVGAAGSGRSNAAPPSHSKAAPVEWERIPDPESEALEKAELAREEGLKQEAKKVTSSRPALRVSQKAAPMSKEQLLEIAQQELKKAEGHPETRSTQLGVFLLQAELYETSDKSRPLEYDFAKAIENQESLGREVQNWVFSPQDYVEKVKALRQKLPLTSEAQSRQGCLNEQKCTSQVQEDLLLAALSHGSLPSPYQLGLEIREGTKRVVLVDSKSSTVTDLQTGESRPADVNVYSPLLAFHEFQRRYDSHSTGVGKVGGRFRMPPIFLMPKALSTPPPESMVLLRPAPPQKIIESSLVEDTHTKTEAGSSSFWSSLGKILTSVNPLDAIRALKDIPIGDAMKLLSSLDAKSMEIALAALSGADSSTLNDALKNIDFSQVNLNQLKESLKSLDPETTRKIAQSLQSGVQNMPKEAQIELAKQLSKDRSIEIAEAAPKPLPTPTPPSPTQLLPDDPYNPNAYQSNHSLAALYRLNCPKGQNSDHGSCCHHTSKSEGHAPREGAQIFPILFASTAVVKDPNSQSDLVQLRTCPLTFKNQHDAHHFHELKIPQERVDFIKELQKQSLLSSLDRPEAQDFLSFLSDPSKISEWSADRILHAAQAAQDINEKLWIMGVVTNEEFISKEKNPKIKSLLEEIFRARKAFAEHPEGMLRTLKDLNKNDYEKASRGFWVLLTQLRSIDPKDMPSTEEVYGPYFSTWRRSQTFDWDPVQRLIDTIEKETDFKEAPIKKKPRWRKKAQNDPVAAASSNNLEIEVEFLDDDGKSAALTTPTQNKKPESKSEPKTQTKLPKASKSSLTAVAARANVHLKKETVEELISIRSMLIAQGKDQPNYNSYYGPIHLSPQLETRYIESLTPSELIKMDVFSFRNYFFTKEENSVPLPPEVSAERNELEPRIHPEVIETFAKQLEKLIEMKTGTSSPELSSIHLDSMITLPGGKQAPLREAPALLRKLIQ